MVWEVKLFGDVVLGIVKYDCVMMVDSCIELLCGVRVSMCSCPQVRIGVI